MSRITVNGNLYESVDTPEECIEDWAEYLGHYIGIVNGQWDRNIEKYTDGRLFDEEGLPQNLLDEYLEICDNLTGIREYLGGLVDKLEDLSRY